MSITNIKKIVDDFVKRNKDCLLRNQFTRGLSDEDAVMLKKSFEELLVSLIMELEENETLSDAVQLQCSFIKTTTKELTLILGSPNREATLEENVRALSEHLKTLRAELEKAPVDANEFEALKSNLKVLHDYYTRRDVFGAKDAMGLVVATADELQQCGKVPEETVRERIASLFLHSICYVHFVFLVFVFVDRFAILIC
jgi:hypothetical protein